MSKPVEAPAARTPRWVWLLAPALAFLLYLPTLWNGFVLDDSILILKDPRMGSLGAFFQLRHSELVVRYWSLLIDSAIWKTNPMGFHLTNALLHAATGLCVFAYLRKLLALALAHPGAIARRKQDQTPAVARTPAGPFGLAWRDWTALAAALLFAAHPMLTEAVAGVTHRKETLATLFLVLALWRALPPAGAVAWSGAARARRAAEVGAYVALALFAKAPAVVFFPLVLLQDIWIRRRAVTAWLRGDICFYIPAALALAGYLAYRWGGLAGAVESNPVYFEAYNPQAAKLSTGGRLLTSLSVLGLYWRLLFVPWRPMLERFVAPGHGLWPFLMLAVAVAAVAVAFRVGRRRPVAALGLVWLVLAPLPTLNILPLNFLFSERYLYLPSVGIALLAAALMVWLAERLHAARMASVIGVAALLLFFAPLTVVRATEWRDVDTLFRVTLRDNPNSPRVAYLHAVDLRDAGHHAESLAEAQRAIRLAPDSPDAWYVAARNYAELGNKAAALDAYARAIQLARKPRSTWLNDYAVALIQNGRMDEAAPVLEAAMARDRGDTKLRDNYAQLLLYRPQTRGRGLAFVEAETRSRPADFTPWVLLVEARIASGDLPGAQAAGQAASTALTGPAERQFLAARLAEAQGHTDEALRAYRAIMASADADPSLKDRARTALRRMGAASE